MCQDELGMGNDVMSISRDCLSSSTAKLCSIVSIISRCLCGVTVLQSTSRHSVVTRTLCGAGLGRGTGPSFAADTSSYFPAACCNAASKDRSSIIGRGDNSKAGAFGFSLVAAGIFGGASLAFLASRPSRRSAPPPTTETFAGFSSFSGPSNESIVLDRLAIGSSSPKL